MLFEWIVVNGTLDEERDITERLSVLLDVKCMTAGATLWKGAYNRGCATKALERSISLLIAIDRDHNSGGRFVTHLKLS